MNHSEEFYAHELNRLQTQGNRRTLSVVSQQGKWIFTERGKMLNLSSNDYLGLASDTTLYSRFMDEAAHRNLPFSASSSRLLTGSFTEHYELEQLLARRFGREAALVFSSGYHMNTGILPAVADARSLILADKLVHASLIDGIRLSAARCIRYRHQDYNQLEALLDRYQKSFDRIFIVTESIFSMDGDVAPLYRLTALKRKYPHVLLYVDEAHAIGVRGSRGLGIAEEQGCLQEIDLLCGTFGKALASVGAYVVCSRSMKDYLVNRARTLIYTTALPPVNMAWTYFIFSRLPEWTDRRQRLEAYARTIRRALSDRGCATVSQSHILPVVVGQSEAAQLQALRLQQDGFYVLPVRPPTVPEGTSRLRLSLTAALDLHDVERLAQTLCNNIRE